MPDRKTRAARRAQQTAEVEASQAKMRENIAETNRLMDESDKMLRRHRSELDQDDIEDQSGSNASSKLGKTP